MKGKGVVAFAAMAMLFAVPAYAADNQYASIVHNLINGVNDTSFDHNTGVFTVDSTATNQITLNDPSPLTGTISNSHILLTTTFNSVEVIQGTPRGKFTGGSLSLTFDYDADGAGPGLPTSHEISGPITALWFQISQAGSFGRLDGLGRWTASTVNLPGSNDWPATTFSSIDTLTIDFNDPLTNFNWETDDLSDRAETQYTLLPTDVAIPEPGTIALLAFGSLALLRRRDD
jgi:hypothetical protein